MDIFYKINGIFTEIARHIKVAGLGFLGEMLPKFGNLIRPH